jgi:hypothetical protein
MRHRGLFRIGAMIGMMIGVQQSQIRAWIGAGDQSVNFLISPDFPLKLWKWSGLLNLVLNFSNRTNPSKGLRKIMKNCNLLKLRTARFVLYVLYKSRYFHVRTSPLERKFPYMYSIIVLYHNAINLGFKFWVNEYPFFLLNYMGKGGLNFSRCLKKYRPLGHWKPLAFD